MYQSQPPESPSAGNRQRRICYRGAVKLARRICVLAALLMLAGCGRDEEIVVTFEDSRPPGTTPEPKAAPVPPAPSPQVAKPPPAAPVVPSVSPPPLVPQAPKTPGRLPHAVAIFCEAPFFPSVDVTLTPTGATTRA